MLLAFFSHKKKWVFFLLINNPLPLLYIHKSLAIVKKTQTLNIVKLRIFKYWSRRADYEWMSWKKQSCFEDKMRNLAMWRWAEKPTCVINWSRQLLMTICVIIRGIFYGYTDFAWLDSKHLFVLLTSFFLLIAKIT